MTLQHLSQQGILPLNQTWFKLLLMSCCWLLGAMSAVAQYRLAPNEEVLAPGITAWVDPQAGVVHLDEGTTTALPGQLIVDPQTGATWSQSPALYSTAQQSPTNSDWQVLPIGHIYRGYLAGPRESRMSAVPFYEQEQGWLIDFAIGGRFGLLRYGTSDAIMPQGFQIDVEAAAFPRLDPQEEFDLQAVDFRGGVPLTWGYGQWRTKLAYYHLSSHVGDEFQLKNPTFRRLNYARDAIVLGQSYYVTPDLRLYAEAAWSFFTDGGAEPWEFQFGVEYSPITAVSANGTRGFGPWGNFMSGKVVGAPFFAVHGYLRQDINYSGNVIAQAGWQWRNPVDGRLLRLGSHYSNGPSYQFDFFSNFEQQFGLGVWYDF